MSGEEIVYRKTNRQSVLLKDKRRLREKRRSTGIGELNLDNLMPSDELTASNTALNESPLLPVDSRSDCKPVTKSQTTFVYPITDREASSSNLRHPEVVSSNGLKSVSDDVTPDSTQDFSFPAELSSSDAAPVNCRQCTIVLEALSALQMECREMRKDHEKDFQDHKLQLKEKDNEIETLVRKVALLSDTLKLADDSYTRLKEENEIFIKHCSSNSAI